MMNMVSIILFLLLMILLLLILICIITVTIKDMLHNKKIMSFLKSNNITEDLIFLKIVDENNKLLPKYRRPLLFKKYLKQETNNTELKSIKNAYRMFLRKSMIGISVMFVMIILISFAIDYFQT